MIANTKEILSVLMDLDPCDKPNFKANEKNAGSITAGF